MAITFMKSLSGGCQSTQPSAPVRPSTARVKATPPADQRAVSKTGKQKQCVPTLYPANSKLDAKVTPTKQEPTGIIARISRSVRNFFYSKCKGKDASRPEIIHQAMRTIGATPLSLTTSKGVETRGMHFTVEAFAQQMRATGAQNVTLTRKDQTQVPAVVLDQKHPNYKTLMNSLNEMGFFAKDHLNERTGEQVRIGDGVWEMREINGKTYLWTKDNFAKMEGCFRNKTFNADKVSVNTASLKPFSAPQAEHTVVLNGGLYSYFESYRTSSEVAKFLALGMNVVISEDKNPHIIDTESRENVIASRDAIYARLQDQGLRNDQIIWKGTCFSAIPAVEAAAKYPGSHVVIDQGYVSSTEMVQQQIHPVLRPVLSPAVRPVLRAMDFDYEMENFLPAVTGNVAIITNNNDSVIPKGHLSRMKTALANREFSVLEINDPEVKHAGGWFNDRECNARFTTLLRSKGWSAAEILG